jgi:hypothetical protein
MPIADLREERDMLLLDHQHQLGIELLILQQLFNHVRHKFRNLAFRLEIRRPYLLSNHAIQMSTLYLAEFTNQLERNTDETTENRNPVSD